MSKTTTQPVPGSNWAQLKPKLAASSDSASSSPKRRKTRMSGVAHFVRPAERSSSSEAGPSKPTLISISAPARVREDVVLLPSPSDAPLVNELRSMVSGHLALSEGKRAPGNYIAIDCEMVGLGPLGSESALARVSIVNYHGHTLLDTFVAPRERVTDWRTWVSGVRESDMIGAPEFEEVQKKVAELLEGRVLVGHAIANDLKALLLDHPGPMIRDTQRCKPLREKAKTKVPSLRKLVAMELGLEIQKGSHSSVTDARATMALYRLHKTQWERDLRHVTEAYRVKSEAVKGKGKRKREDKEEEREEDEAEDGEKEGERKKKAFPGGGRKGISSGLSVVVKRNGQRVEGGRKRGDGGGGGEGGGEGAGGGGNWWEAVPGGA
ncbi:ribonuclease H-like domain-containing protein [Naematelia encephala]|uniref:RNA exonuclease 4 n=1 Tax=Naematelia encephala TaxID=71784 RepID=A0A1Y2B1D8_9TREE|nr:ribonuclease H-like domain-containing protein [Naematelia encephala]